MSDATHDLIARLRSDSGAGETHWNDCREAADLIERVIGDLPQDAIDGGWTALGMSKYAKKLETQIETLKRERDEAVALLRSIPTTPETMVAFIGSNFNSMQAEGWTDTLPAEPTGDLSAVKYSLSVHDLLSAFSWVGLDVAAISTLTRPADRGNT